MSEEGRKVRVTIFLNGEQLATSGKLLVIPQGCAWDELLAKAANKLGALRPLKRVFVSNGAEATDVEEILNGDELYFSYGEDFFGDENIEFLNDETATSEQKIEKKQFLARMAKQVVSMASSAYDSSSTYVKQKAPYFKVTLEQVENKVGGMATPVISKVVEYGTWADEKLDGYYFQFNKVYADFLESPVAKTVNDKLVLLKERVVDPSTAFYKKLYDNFQHLLESSKKDGKTFSAEDFVTAVKGQLGKAWNEKLVEPAKAFYVAAMDKVTKNEALASTRQSLDHLWKDTVVQNFKVHVQAPAESFYQTALQSYLALKETGNGKVTFEEFSAAMRVKMGKLWNEHLAEPAKYLFEKFHLQSLQLQATGATVQQPASPQASQNAP